MTCGPMDDARPSPAVKLELPLEFAKRLCVSLSDWEMQAEPFTELWGYLEEAVRKAEVE